MLRAIELGISVQDLDFLSVGMVLDIFEERINDSDKNIERDATQNDIDNF